MKLKKIMTSAVCLFLLLPSCNYKQDLEGLKSSVEALKAKLVSMNENIALLKELVEAATAAERVTKIETVVEDGVEVGTKFYFAHRDPIIIYNGEKGDDGKDGEDGKDGITPSITIKQDEDGIWYWTLNGEWLLDGNGNRLKVVGTDGVVPTMKVEDGKWWITYDGENWTELGDVASAEELSPVSGIGYNDNEVYIYLRNGDWIFLPRYSCFVVNFPDGQEVTMGPNEYKEIRCEFEGTDNSFPGVIIQKFGKFNASCNYQSNQKLSVSIGINTEEDFNGGVIDVYFSYVSQLYYKKITVNKR